MQETNMRIHPLNHLAVKLQHKAQHPVRRRMLRAEVDREIAEVLVSHCFFPTPPSPSRPQAAARLPMGSGNRNGGTPDSAAPDRSAPAFLRRRSAPRRNLSLGSPCA